MIINIVITYHYYYYLSSTLLYEVTKNNDLYLFLTSLTLHVFCDQKLVFERRGKEIHEAWWRVFWDNTLPFSPPLICHFDDSILEDNNYYIVNPWNLEILTKSYEIIFKKIKRIKSFEIKTAIKNYFYIKFLLPNTLYHHFLPVRTFKIKSSNLHSKNSTTQFHPKKIKRTE